jgi:hypothetical protein
MKKPRKKAGDFELKDAHLNRQGLAPRRMWQYRSPKPEENPDERLIKVPPEIGKIVTDI